MMVHMASTFDDPSQHLIYFDIRQTSWQIWLWHHTGLLSNDLEQDVDAHAQDSRDVTNA